MHYLDPKSQVLSGIALQEIDIAMQNKVEKAQTLMGDAYQEVFELAAKACGVIARDITVNWKQPFRQDTTQNDILEVKAKLMSRRKFLEKQGMTPTEIDAEIKLIDEEASKMAAATPALTPESVKPQTGETQNG